MIVIHPRAAVRMSQLEMLWLCAVARAGSWSIGAGTAGSASRKFPMSTLRLVFPSIRLNLIDYARLRGQKVATPMPERRVIRVCGVVLWK